MKQDEDTIKGRQSPTRKEDEARGTTTGTENMREEMNDNNINNDKQKEMRITKDGRQQTIRHKRGNNEKDIGNREERQKTTET